MGYKVIHLIEAVDWLEEIEYARLVEQCRQIFCYLAGNAECMEQVCLTFSDKVKEIQIDHGRWPGDTAFRRPRRRKKLEKNEQKVCFEEALYAASAHMQSDEDWIVILYTAGAVKRSKRTMLTKWKKTLVTQPALLAVKTDRSDRSFLESYTETDKVFEAGMLEDAFQWLDGKRNLPDAKHQKIKRETELWKIIRDCFV